MVQLAAWTMPSDADAVRRVDDAVAERRSRRRATSSKSAPTSEPLPFAATTIRIGGYSCRLEYHKTPSPPACAEQRRYGRVHNQPRILPTGLDRMNRVSTFARVDRFGPRSTTCPRIKRRIPMLAIKALARRPGPKPRSLIDTAKALVRPRRHPKVYREFCQDQEHCVYRGVESLDQLVRHILDSRLHDIDNYATGEWFDEPDHDHTVIWDGWKVALVVTFESAKTAHVVRFDRRGHPTIEVVEMMKWRLEQPARRTVSASRRRIRLPSREAIHGRRRRPDD